MDEAFEVRPARIGDAEALLAIYRPFVERATISFELEAPSVTELQRRIETGQQSHAWLVAAVGDLPIGYAYGGAHRQREAYRWSTEVSAYVRRDWQRCGVARRLYEQLFTALAARGYCNALAGITLPNEPSIALHERLGFTHLGTYHQVGYKFGAWHDVAWYERRLRDGPPEPLR